MSRARDAWHSEDHGDAAGDPHSEAWWLRLLDDDLSQREQVQWAQHLQSCGGCQEMWQAMNHVDAILRSAEAAPSLPPAFTIATARRIGRQQLLHRWLALVVGALILGTTAFVILGVLGSAYSALQQSLGALISARQLLFRSAMHVLVGVVVSWRTLVPFVAGLVCFAYLVAMPNGVLVTLGLLWLSRRRRFMTAAQ